MSDRGSISIEAAVGIALLMAVVGLFFSIIYGSYIQGVSYSEATEAFLRLNHEKLSERTIERELSLEYSQMGWGYELITFKGIKDKMPIAESGFSQAVNYVTYITDTGTKYHRPLCPTVKLSLRPILYEDAVQYYTPCAVCNPKQNER